MSTHTHTHTWLSDATLEGGFNLMRLMLTLVARNTHAHPLIQTCLSFSFPKTWFTHFIYFFFSKDQFFFPHYYRMCSHLKMLKVWCKSPDPWADWGSITPLRRVNPSRVVLDHSFLFSWIVLWNRREPWWAPCANRLALSHCVSVLSFWGLGKLKIKLFLQRSVPKREHIFKVIGAPHG